MTELLSTYRMAVRRLAPVPILIVTATTVVHCFNAEWCGARPGQSSISHIKRVGMKQNI